MYVTQHNAFYTPQTLLKTETISFNMKKKEKVSTFSTLIQYSTWLPCQSNKARERKKGIQIGKEDDVILYLNGPKDTAKTFLDRINIFINLAGYIKLTCKSQ
jgi:hypothetical protein